MKLIHELFRVRHLYLKILKSGLIHELFRVRQKFYYEITLDKLK